MTDLLVLALEAHGGLKNWKSVTGVDLRLTLGGYLFEIKQHPDGLRTALVKVDARRPRTLIVPFPEQGKRGIYQEGKVWVQTDAGRWSRSCRRRAPPTKATNGTHLGTISNTFISSGTPSGITSRRPSCSRRTV